MPKNAQTTTQVHSSHTLVKVMLKILQARLQQYVNRELPDVHAGFIISWQQVDGETMETVTDFIFLAPKSL